MRKWILAGAVVTVGCFLAEPVAPAQGVVQAQGTVITSQPRVGLFGRIRDRREMRVVEPASMRTITTSSTTTPSTVVRTESTTPSTTTPSATTQSTTPSSTLAPAQTNEVQPRQGLLSRLRSRRAR